jgi:predicted RNA-binding protein with PIN domain
MKKLLLILILPLMIFTLTGCKNEYIKFIYEFTNPNSNHPIWYENGIVVTDYEGNKKDIEIPSEIDGYKVVGNPGEVLKYHNIYVVYTKEAETADLYIEKTTHELVKNYKVTVATSDAVEQVIIFGAGAFRMSASMLQEEVRRTEQQIRTDYVEKTSAGKSYLLDSLTEEELQSLKEESEDREQEQS